MTAKKYNIDEEEMNDLHDFISWAIDALEDGQIRSGKSCVYQAFFILEEGVIDD